MDSQDIKKNNYPFILSRNNLFYQIKKKKKKKKIMAPVTINSMLI